MVHLETQVLTTILAHAERMYPRECCGFLLGPRGRADGILAAEQADNLAPADRPDRFELDPRAYLQVDRQARARGWDILGFYHSHPDAEPMPSATDLARAWPGYLYLIVSVHAGRVDRWRGWRLVAGAAAAAEFQEVPLTSDGCA